MLEKNDKAKELAENVAVKILDCIKADFEDISNIDCVTGVLMGATAIVSTVHRSMDEDHYEKKTAETLTLWASMHRKHMVKNPDPEK